MSGKRAQPGTGQTGWAPAALASAPAPEPGGAGASSWGLRRGSRPGGVAEGLGERVQRLEARCVAERQDRIPGRAGAEGASRPGGSR